MPNREPQDQVNQIPRKSGSLLQDDDDESVEAGVPADADNELTDVSLKRRAAQDNRVEGADEDVAAAAAGTEEEDDADDADADDVETEDGEEEDGSGGHV